MDLGLFRRILLAELEYAVEAAEFKAKEAVEAFTGNDNLNERIVCGCIDSTKGPVISITGDSPVFVDWELAGEKRNAVLTAALESSMYAVYTAAGNAFKRWTEGNL